MDARLDKDQFAFERCFAEATSGQDLRSWIGSHMRAFEFFGGVTEVVVYDLLPGTKS
jgi:transposase